MSEAKEQHEKRPDGQEAGTTRSYDGSALRPGGQIGPFRIEQELGRGAMGVVYLAHDTELDRPVAIKSLPAELMEHATAKARFAREARVLASLNHPNIATIYEELHEAEGVGYLVLEYVSGQTLAERIARAGLKLHEALSIAQQIAEAVAAAHEREVIHRDLKPGNIKITPEGRIKVLDFGLAKALGAKEADKESTVTEPGRLMGTPAYMSPEQVRGAETDKRCDIWSFGCVLYEMLTGKVPFEDETVSASLVGILDREPDWNALPEATPANIRVLLRRCLEKELHRRLHDIADAVIEINETLSGTLETLAPPGEVPRVSWSFRRYAIYAALACLTAGVLIVGPFFIPPDGPNSSESPVVSRLSIPVPADKALYTGKAPNRFLAISPDGTHLVYVGESDDRSTELYRRSLDDPLIQPIPGTGNAHNPFFKPDGQWVGFFTEKQLKKVALAGGEPVILLEDIPLGDTAFGSWAEDGTIVFSVHSGNSGLQRISEDGGQQAETLVARESDIDEAHYCYPQVLLGGDAILYSMVYSNAPRRSCVEAFFPETGKTRDVLDYASYATYVSSDHLIFVRDNVLMAAPFDVEKLETTGPSVPLVKDDMEFDWTGQTPQIAISANGTLVYVSGSELRKGELVWVDRRGSILESLVADAAVYEGLRLSPDGRLIAVGIRSQEEGNIRVNVYNLRLGTFAPLIPKGESSYPQWSPNGKRVAFWGWEQRIEDAGVFCKIVGASAPAERLASTPPGGIFLHPYAWSGNHLTCTVLDPNTREDIWVIDLDGERKLVPVHFTEHREYNPTVSPDGRWLAYVSDESGQAEIILEEYPDPGHRWTVPTREATNPAWSHDGRELYYISGNSMMAVEITSEPNFPIGAPEPLFESSDLVVSGGSLRRNYDVSDDERFLMVKWGGEARDQLVVVQHWFEELKRIAPPGRGK